MVPRMTLHDDDTLRNTSDNPWLGDLITSRRSLIAGGIAATVVALVPSTVVGASASQPASGPPATAKKKPGKIGFAPIPAGTRADTITVPAGYSWQVLAPWGDPIVPGGPAFSPGVSNSSTAQSRQIGMHHDGMHYFPLKNGPKGSERGLLVMNHEYVDQGFLFGYPTTDPARPALTAEQLAIALAAHGVSVLEIERHKKVWRVVKSKHARRITGDTPVAFSGPVSASHPMLATGQPPRGTLNNCAHGHTPWGTYLACEENFNGYFGATRPFSATPIEARYGISATGFTIGGGDNRSVYNWQSAPGSRFDLSNHRNEPNRFGWVVEIDPFDPKSTPVKRTALGRFKHEGAFVHVTKGKRLAVYMGDDENGDYLYKFVSRDNYEKLLKQGKSPLDEGTLYVAKFSSGGTGQWMPLVHGVGPLTVAQGWADQADVLIRTRQAADALGATKLDRPEWTAVDPETGTCYVTLTNGAGGPTRSSTSGKRGMPVADGGNGSVGNPFGQIVRWNEAGNDHAATTFTWEVFMFAGDPTKADVPDTNVADEDRFGSPDGLWIDPDRRVWIQTDISNSTQNLGRYDRIGNNQMLCADPEIKDLRRFLSGPEGCEVTGVITTPDQRTMFVNIQHPGESPQSSTFPFGSTPPRSATVVITKNDGGVIGT